MVRRYRVKSFEGIQYNGKSSNIEEIRKFINGTFEVYNRDTGVAYLTILDTKGEKIKLLTVFVCDYIIKDSNGSLHVWKRSDFEDQFEAVEEES